MESEIFLQRPNPQTPWGFRIVGGSDYNIPIIISKVLEDSIAEKAGLKEDFLIEGINSIPISGMTHAQVDEIIVAAEMELQLSVSDREFQLPVEREFGQIMTTESSDKAHQLYCQENLKKIFSSQELTTDKKWSTFLQKPKNPTPKIKGQTPPIPKSQQYRVVIEKQKKKKPKMQLPSNDTNLEKEVMIAEFIEKSKDDEVDVTENQNNKDNEEGEDLKEYPMVIAEVRETMQDEEETVSYQCEPIEVTVEDEEAEDCLINESNHYASEENKELDVPETKNELSLEEQLAVVQKQLQELAALPSAIQETLSEVTQQLASIVGECKPEMNTEEIVLSVKNVDDCDTLSANEENEILGEEVQKDAEISETAEMEDPPSDILSDICEEEEVLDIITEDPTFQQSEAVPEQHDEKSVNQQLDSQLAQRDEESELKNPIVRPIILPGGRKWADPDDAETKVKNPKMTDEKICNTIETFSEVICGKTKGINFLKYTPPPKNLEYLQRSEVFRLIHGMEPPVRGINIRSEKILAEEDYYKYSGN